MRLRAWALAIVVVAIIGAVAVSAATMKGRAASPTVMAPQTSDYGRVLVSGTGRALYRFTRDRRGVSTCNSSCTVYWPPYLINPNARLSAGAGAKASLLGTIRRGSKRQVTYAGWPLYMHAADQKPGDTTGQGITNTWYLVKPTGVLVKHIPAAGVASTPSDGGDH